MKYKIWPLSLVFIFWAAAYAQNENIDPIDPVVDDAVEAPAIEKPAVVPVTVDESVEPVPAVESPVAPASIALPLKRPSSGSGDEPDLTYEAQLHDIYLNFNSKRMPMDQWQSIAGERQSENYNIQKGDSLWNISKTLFSDGNYWPKIWSLNGSIENPHLIKEGNSIKFLMGNESEAPSFTVTETVQEDEEDSSPSKVVHNESVEIPPPVIEPKPVIRNLPPSLPQWQSTKNLKYDLVGFSYVRRPILDMKSKVKLPAYYDEDETKGLGVVREVETGGRTASQFQYIYVELPAGQYKKGDRFMVVRNMGEIEGANTNVDDENLGYQIQIQGEITLEEKTDKHESEESGQDMFRALVTQNITHVEVGSVLVKGNWLYGDYSEHGPKSLVVSQIVGGSSDNKALMFGPGSVTFLNRGATDGLAVGQILPIRSNRKLRDPNSIVFENTRPIGYLKIVRTTPHVATAIVIKAFEDIFPGDLTGQGAMIPTAGTEAPAVETEDKESVLEEMSDEQAGDETSVEDADQSASGDDSFENEDDTTDQSSDDNSDLDSEVE